MHWEGTMNSESITACHVEGAANAKPQAVDSRGTPRSSLSLDWGWGGEEGGRRGQGDRGQVEAGLFLAKAVWSRGAIVRPRSEHTFHS